MNNNLKYMQDNFDKQETTTDKLAPVTGVSAEVLTLQAFIMECIEKNLKGKAIEKLATEQGLKYTYVSLLNKITAYKSDGINALMRKERKDKNESKSFSNSVLMTMQGFFGKCQCIITSYKKTHDALMENSLKFLHKGTIPYDIKNNGQGKYVLTLSDSNVHAIFPTIYENGAYITTEGEELLMGSYATAKKYFTSIKKNNGDLLFKNRHGLENYRLKRQRAMKLDYSRLLPNDLISMDAKQCDTVVISECGRYIFRPWLSGGMDASTRRYHFELCRTPNSDAIANAICSITRIWGVPKEVNFDRGRDYTSHRVQQLLDVLKCKKRKSIRKLARSKMIESFHNILDHLLKSLPGYTGNNRDEMPQETRDMLRKYTTANKEIKKHEKMLKDGMEFYVSLNANPEGRLRSSKKRFLFIDEFITQLNKALDHYHERVHGGLKTDELGKKVYDRLCNDELINKYGERLNTPNGRYEYHIEKGLQIVYTEPAAIAMFAMNSEIRIVQYKKGIEFRGEEFWDSKLKTLIGQQVLLRYTNTSTSELYVFHSDALQGVDGRKNLTPEILSGLKYVCLASKWEKIHYNDEIYKAKIADQRREEKHINKTLGIGKIYQINGMESEMEKIINDENELNAEKNPVNKYKDVDLY